MALWRDERGVFVHDLLFSDSPSRTSASQLITLPLG